MSAITEALKKAEHKHRKTTVTSSAMTSEMNALPIFSTPSAGQKTKAYPVAVLAILMLVFTFGGTWLVGSSVKMFKSQSRQPTAGISRSIDSLPHINTLPGAVPGSASSPILDASQAEKFSQPALALNGIMLSSQVPQALINNTISKEGDVVYGFSVVKISRSQVILEKDGQTISLSVKQ